MVSPYSGVNPGHSIRVFVSGKVGARPFVRRRGRLSNNVPMVIKRHESPVLGVGLGATWAQSPAALSGLCSEIFTGRLFRVLAFFGWFGSIRFALECDVFARAFEQCICVVLIRRFVISMLRLIAFRPQMIVIIGAYMLGEILLFLAKVVDGVLARAVFTQFSPSSVRCS